MRPTRKSRSVNKWNDYFNEAYPVKDVDNSKRNNDRKRKLSDTPQWSKEELRRFYEAYRELGKDWKKVAAVLRNRSVKMVESLYKMNRAYLSLPEGTASAVGLIAMMSDHYSNLGRTDSEQESNDDAETYQKPQKRIRGKVEPNNSNASGEKFNSSSPVTASSNGRVPLVKTTHIRGNRARVSGKRTPRCPVSYSSEDTEGEKFLSSTRQSLKKKADVNDEGAVHEIGLSLREASAKDGPHEVSNRVSRSVKSPPSQTAELKHAELKCANRKSVRDDEDLEGSTKDGTGKLSRHRTYRKQSGPFGTLVRKGRNIDGKKLDADESRDNHLDDWGEVGQRLSVVCEKISRDARISSASLQGSRKKTKKDLVSRDEVSVAEALQTLKVLPPKMPSVQSEDESMMEIEIKEEKDNLLQESRSLEATPGKKVQRKKRRSSGVRIKRAASISPSEIASNKMPRSCKVPAIDDKSAPEMEEETCQSKTMRKKPHMLASKARDVEKMNKTKRSSQNASAKQVEDAEHSSKTHLTGKGSDPAKSTLQVQEADQISLPTRVRSRRKIHLKKPQKDKDLKFPGKVTNEEYDTLTALVHGEALFTLKDKLIHCLSNPQLRRWCTYEWFYSSIDYPWFAKREFVEYLYHVGLGHVPKLTHAEWGVIRSSLGKPRRFSQQFLKEEKRKLDQYRDSVRKHYADLRKGTLEGLPTDLARPLSVGQRVIAIHPKEREIHGGKVLTVDNSSCRVQFDRPELGVELVMDIDCMPLNHWENVPTPLERHMTHDKLSWKNELRREELAKTHRKASHGDEIENINVLPHLSPTCSMANLSNWTKMAAEDANKQNGIAPTEKSTYQEIIYSQPPMLDQIQAKKADVQALAELTCALDKKEAVVSELKHANNDMVDNCSLKESEPFEKHYKAVLLKLHEANDQVSSSLFHLRQQNAFQETRPVANLGDRCGPLNSFNHSARQPHVSGHDEIIESSRTIARTMVHFTVQELDPALMTASDRIDEQIPVDLITRCVATLITIQKCSERQFPPADIARVLQSAVTSLKPRCSKNLGAYAEIQKSVGMIKNQILSLLPA